MTGEQTTVAFTPEEFLAWEEAQPIRHEYVGGRAYAMTGGTERHSFMTGQLYLALAPMVLEAGCRPFGEGRRLRVPARNFYYPDFFAVCGPRGDDLHENDASLVIEVLSRTTRTIDQREKLDAYGTLPSIKQYVLVEPDIRRFQVVEWKGGVPSWTDLGPSEGLKTEFGVVDLDTVYEAVDSLSDDD